MLYGVKKRKRLCENEINISFNRIFCVRQQRLEANNLESKLLKMVRIDRNEIEANNGLKRVYIC